MKNLNNNQFLTLMQLIKFFESVVGACPILYQDQRSFRKKYLWMLYQKGVNKKK